MTSRPATERRRVIYSGNVQGVGFRFTARRVAERHAVNGYVRNLSNGDVELVAEGEPDTLNRFLADVAKAMGGYIRDARTQSAQPTGEFSSFEIAY